MKKISQTWGWYLVFGTAFVPVILWTGLVPLQYRFDNLTTTLLSLGRLCGLVGACLFSLNFVLAARPKWLEGSFGGLNKVFRAHHTIGGVAFILLLLHPALLTAQYLPTSFIDAAGFVLLYNNWPQNFGRLALVTLIAVLIITYYLPLKYHIWKLSHQVVGLALFFGYLHVFLIPSDISRYPSLRYYMLTVVSIGLIAFFYRVIFGKYLVSRYRYTVSSIQKFAGGVLEIHMKPEVRRMAYKAGQFIFMSQIQEGISPEFHPFSITSPTNSEILSVAIKSLGDFTNTLSQLKTGGLVKIEGPFGQFHPNRYSLPNQIWIAGGIGITPFLSMARSRDRSAAVTLYYVVNSVDEAVFLPELLVIEKDNPAFSVHVHETKTSGLITATVIKGLEEINDKELFICGPKPMMRALKSQFIAIGIAKERVHTEEFDL
jgi:predicted ferric reductase